MLDTILHSPRFRVFRRVQFAIALGVYTYLYLSPDPLGGRAMAFGESSLHAVGSGLLFLSLYVAAREKLGLFSIVALACAISFLFESAQAFSTIRTFEWGDVRVNLMGIAGGAASIAIIYALGALKRA